MYSHIAYFVICVGCCKIPIIMCIRIRFDDRFVLYLCFFHPFQTFCYNLRNATCLFLVHQALLKRKLAVAFRKEKKSHRITLFHIAAIETIKPCVGEELRLSINNSPKLTLPISINLFLASKPYLSNISQNHFFICKCFYDEPEHNRA